MAPTGSWAVGLASIKKEEKSGGCGDWLEAAGGVQRAGALAGSD